MVVRVEGRGPVKKGGVRWRDVLDLSHEATRGTD